MQNENDFIPRSISQFALNVYVSSKWKHPSEIARGKSKHNFPLPRFSPKIPSHYESVSDNHPQIEFAEGNQDIDPYSNLRVTVENEIYHEEHSEDEELLPSSLYEMPNPHIMIPKIIQDVISMETQRNKELQIAMGSENYAEELQHFQRAYGGLKTWRLVIYSIEELQSEFQSLVCVLFWILLEKLQRRCIVFSSNHVDEWNLDDKVAEIWTKILLKLPTEGSNKSFSAQLSYSDFIHFISLLLFRLFLYNFPDDATELHQVEMRKWIISECNFYIYGKGNIGQSQKKERAGRIATYPSSARIGTPKSSRASSARFTSRSQNSSTRHSSRIEDKTFSKTIDANELDSSRTHSEKKGKSKFKLFSQYELFLLPSDLRFVELAEFKLDDSNAIQEELEKASNQPSVRMDLKSLRKAVDSENQQKKQLLKRLESEHRDLLSFSAEGMADDLDAIDQVIAPPKVSALPNNHTVLSPSKQARKKVASKEEQSRKRGLDFIESRQVEKEWYERGKGSDFKITKPRPVDVKGFYSCATERRTGPLIKRYLMVLHQEQREAELNERKKGKRTGRIRYTPTPDQDFNQTMQMQPNETFFITGNNTSFLSTNNETTLNTHDLAELEEDDGYVESFLEVESISSSEAYLEQIARM